MSHPRSEMRRSIRDALVASVGMAGVRVFKSWSHSVGREDVPAVGVFTPREITRGGTGDSVDRTTTIVVLYRAEGGDDLDDDLDDISAVIEPIVLDALADFQLFALDETDIEINGEGEKRQGRLTLTFSAERYTPEGTPS
ncbi:MAG: hypothetical protein ABJL67_13485 [Sulfitobacter sp.]